MAKTKNGSRLPRRHKNKAGKETGSFFWTDPDGKEINLRTKDATEANKRMVAAKLHGRRDFQDDSGGAARAVADAVAGTGGASTPPVVEPAAPAA
ncbi:MAG TPA: hypothetical protein VE261_01565, partial [Gaiellaceae bacterium]|nr:hypothetical protein [Gaiellaceae bacterium]